MINHIIVRKKIKVNLKRENTQEGGGSIGFLKEKFKHNKFKQNKDKYKKIRLEIAKSYFIMVWHPLPISTLLKLLTK